MKTTIGRISSSLLLLTILGLGFPQALSSTSPPGQRVVKVSCMKGADGAAVGEYGGTSFSLACHQDTASMTITVEIGNDAYAIRMLTTSQSGLNVSCLFSGDRHAVAERCGDVRLNIY